MKNQTTYNRFSVLRFYRNSIPPRFSVLRFCRNNVLSLCSFALLLSCTDGDDFDYSKNGLLITGTEQGAIQNFVVEETPATYPITVKTTKKTDSDLTVSLAIDPSLVENYNAVNNTSYYPIPEGSVELDDSQVIIKEGSAQSSAVNVRVISTEGFQEGRTYLIPVTIRQSSSLEAIEASRTLFLKVARRISFYSLKTDLNASSNYIFPDEKRQDLSAWTIEFKCYSNVFGRVGDIKRVLAIEGKNEEEANMFRFGENGSAGGDVLQWVLPGGRAFSNTHFQTGRWYLVSCTYDGQNFTMYVDGIFDVTTSGSGKVCPFQRFELGMSWGNYRRSQFFNGRLAEVRLWNRALSAAEINLGLGSVDPHSEGLVAYWKMNEGEGHIFHDATGNGYDMDWTDTWRDDRENGQLVAHDYSQYIQWIIDEQNQYIQ